MKLLIDASLQVLVEQSLEFLVLLVKKTSLLDQVLTVDQELVVLDERPVQGLPDRELLV